MRLSPFNDIDTFHLLANTDQCSNLSTNIQFVNVKFDVFDIFVKPQNNMNYSLSTDMNICRGNCIRHCKLSRQSYVCTVFMIGMIVHT